MFSTQALINASIIKNSSYSTGQRDGGRFHISDAGGCYRARIYKRLGIAPVRENEIAGLRKMMAGHAGHEKLQKLLWKKLLLAECEVGDENIVGHPDGVIKNGELVLLEIKTTEKWGMSKIKKNGPQKQHVIQMKTYWIYLREIIPSLDHAVLSYIKREDFEAHDLYYKWSENIVSDVEQEWNPLLAYWKDKTLPDCTCKEMYDGSGSKYCRYGTDEVTCCDPALFKKEVSE